MEQQNMPYDRQYALWVLSMQHTDHYFSYLESMIKTVKY